MNVAPLSPPDNIRKFSIKKVELGFVCPRIHCASKLGLFSWADTFFFLFLPSSLRAWPGSDDPCLIDVFDVPPKFLPPLASKKGARRGMRSRAVFSVERCPACLSLERAASFLSRYLLRATSFGAFVRPPPASPAAADKSGQVDVSAARADQFESATSVGPATCFNNTSWKAGPARDVIVSGFPAPPATSTLKLDEKRREGRVSVLASAPASVALAARGCEDALPGVHWL